MAYFFERTLYYVKDFEFANGTKRNKYLLVLAVEGNDVIYTLASHSFTKGLAQEEKKYGCRRKGRIEFFYFPAMHEIALEKYSFPKETAISFMNNICVEPISSLEKYRFDSKCRFEARFKPTVYKEILGCMTTGKHCPSHGTKAILSKKIVK